MKTTAATKNYDYDRYEHPNINSFRQQSPGDKRYARYQTAVKDRKGSPLRRSLSRDKSASLDRKYGF